MNAAAEWITAAGAALTGVGVVVTAWQVRLAERQARTAFEDSMAREYREIARRLPVAALLGEPLHEHERIGSLEDFFRYIDLSNEQVFLRSRSRISAETWLNWRDGIRSNLSRPAFSLAWVEIKQRSANGFSELRRLETSDFEEDPASWDLSHVSPVLEAHRATSTAPPNLRRAN
jgi:hypothetical protein